MPRRSSSGGRNNNPTGRNQYSDRGVMDMVRDRPVAAAAAAASAAAAGLFLWSKRSQITNQLSSLSDQIGDWTDSMRSGEDSTEMMDDTAGLTTVTQASRRSRSASGKRSATTPRKTGRNRGMGEPGVSMGTPSS